VAREVSPLAPAVVSVTTFHAGTASNIIAPTADLCGHRARPGPGLREALPAMIERVIAGVCAALRADYTFDYRLGTPVTVNDAVITDLVREAGRAVLGAENVVELPRRPWAPRISRSTSRRSRRDVPAGHRLSPPAPQPPL
jgi:amidohydrolase